MLSTYCQHCGSKHEYRTTKPNFCSSCGQSLNGEFQESRAQVQKTNLPSSKIEVHDEDGTDVYDVPNITNFEYEIEMTDNSGFTLGSILPQRSEAKKESSPNKRGRPKKNGK